MNVKIEETGEIKTLGIIDPESGVNWVSDLIGNADGKKGFSWSEDDNAYIASQSTYDWWAQYITELEETDSEVIALAEKLGIDKGIIRERIASNTGNDYNDHRSEARHAMNEIKEEYAA